MADPQDPWSELVVDTDFEQAAEATRRLALLARVFYTTLIADDCVPPGLAAPLCLAYMQSVLVLVQKSKKATD